MSDEKKMIAPLTLTDLDELERLEREATGGEWRAVSLGTKIGRSDAQGRAHICGTHRQEGVVSKHEGGTNPSSDARLIAAARNRLPQLLALAKIGVLAVEVFDDWMKPYIGESRATVAVIEAFRDLIDAYKEKHK